jgi:protein TonB
VSPTGQVTDCRVALDSGSPELDQAGCAAFRRRGEFEPAVNSEGQPVQSYSFQRVRWQLPE